MQAIPKRYNTLRYARLSLNGGIYYEKIWLPQEQTAHRIGAAKYYRIMGDTRDIMRQRMHS